MSLDEYPTEEELKTIEEWPVEKGYKELMDYVYEIWKYAKDGGCWVEYKEGGHWTYEIATGGWSGNEDLLDAMSKNLMFWLTCWYSSKRGGHYEFRVPIKDVK